MVRPEVESVWTVTVSAFFIFIFLVLFVHWKARNLHKRKFSWGSESLMQKHLACHLAFLQSGSSQMNMPSSLSSVEIQSASIKPEYYWWQFWIYTSWNEGRTSPRISGISHNSVGNAQCWYPSDTILLQNAHLFFANFQKTLNARSNLISITQVPIWPGLHKSLSRYTQWIKIKSHSVGF